MRLKKSLFALLTVAVLMCAMNMTAYSHDVPDLSQKGSVTITMRQDGTVVSGGTISLYQVGRITETDGNYGFTPTGDFADCGESLDDVQSAKLAQKLAQYAETHQLSGKTKEIGVKGTVSFTQLTPGLYLFKQDRAASGYNKAEPFLVSVPMLENGTYVYDVDASPKVELKKGSSPATPGSPGTPGTASKKSARSLGGKLPQTGQLNWPIPVLVVSGLGMFSVGWMLRFGKKKGIYEK